jgi:hypothetical protein
MNKKILFAITFVAAAMMPFCLQAQAPHTDAQHEGLKGQVQMIRETTCGTHGQTIHTVSVYYYNMIGNYNKVVLEDTLGNPQMEIRYVYDSMGVLARQDRFSMEDTTLLFENTYTRDWRAHTITMSMLGVKDSMDDVVVYSFDKKGYLDKVSTFDSKGNLLSRDFYLYDEHGFRNQITYTEGPDESYRRTECFRYDSDGNVIECRTMCLSAERQRLCYTYDFDHEGNWVKKYVYDLKGKSASLLQTVTRDISYYE